MPGKHLLGCLGMDINAGRRRVQRRRAQVLQASGGGAQKQNFFRHLRSVEVILEDFPQRDYAAWSIRGEMYPKTPLAVDRDLQVPHLDVVQARGFAKILLHIGAGGLQDIG